MKRITFSGENKDIEEIISFYNLCKDAILKYKKHVAGGNLIPEELIGFTVEEFNRFFRRKFTIS